jgi:PTH1 family peptidyl-tRNA hydrolase
MIIIYLVNDIIVTKMKKLIVGLGNPGEKYSYNRHNIGFLAIKKILTREIKFKEKHQALYYETKDTIFLLPQTYMNKSGAAVQAFMAFYKILPKNLLVIHDDLDLSLGQIRVKIGGSSGGHNGLKSIDAAIGKDYLKIRLGIGRPTSQEEVSSFVLSNFIKEEGPLVEKMLSFLADTIEILLHTEVNNEVIGKFLNLYQQY